MTSNHSLVNASFAASLLPGPPGIPGPRGKEGKKGDKGDKGDTASVDTVTFPCILSVGETGVFGTQQVAYGYKLGGLFENGSPMTYKISFTPQPYPVPAGVVGSTGGLASGAAGVTANVGGATGGVAGVGVVGVAGSVSVASSATVATIRGPASTTPPMTGQISLTEFTMSSHVEEVGKTQTYTEGGGDGGVFDRTLSGDFRIIALHNQGSPTGTPTISFESVVFSSDNIISKPPVINWFSDSIITAFVGFKPFNKVSVDYVATFDVVGQNQNQPAARVVSGGGINIPQVAPTSLVNLSSLATAPAVPPSGAPLNTRHFPGVRLGGAHNISGPPRALAAASVASSSTNSVSVGSSSSTSAGTANVSVSSSSSTNTESSTGKMDAAAAQAAAQPAQAAAQAAAAQPALSMVSAAVPPAPGVTCVFQGDKPAVYTLTSNIEDVNVQAFVTAQSQTDASQIACDLGFKTCDGVYSPKVDVSITFNLATGDALDPKTLNIAWRAPGFHPTLVKTVNVVGNVATFTVFAEPQLTRTYIISFKALSTVQK